MSASTDARPTVECTPSVRFGYPHIKGISTYAIAGMVWAGETVTGVADDYGITTAEVLVACWFEATHGRPRSSFRRAWQPWVKRVGPLMWRGVYQVADPPSREEFRDGVA